MFARSSSAYPRPVSQFPRLNTFCEEHVKSRSNLSLLEGSNHINYLNYVRRGVCLLPVYSFRNVSVHLIGRRVFSLHFWLQFHFAYSLLSLRLVAWPCLSRCREGGAGALSSKLLCRVGHRWRWSKASPSRPERKSLQTYLGFAIYVDVWCTISWLCQHLKGALYKDGPVLLG